MLTSKNKKFLKTVGIAGACFLCLQSLFPPTQPLSRELSLNLGNGTCKWQPPVYDVPEDISFYKTLIAGFPSGDKRMTFVQMEALTGWPAKDEWDFQHLGMSNHPFIKANYPHHEGIWGWGDVADQVIMVVRNMRRSMVEYHDILWDIGYAKTWEEASLNLQNLYSERPPLEDFLAWRDLRVMDEIHWYGWFIDYWMEGGLLRDIFTHKITTKQHWDMLMMPTVYSRDEVQYDLIVGNETAVNKTYDPHCATVTNGCEPIQIISAERLIEYDTGPTENRKIALTMTDHPGISEHVIEEEAWQCIWTELIVNKKGLKTFIDREGITERDYNFSTEMLEEMLNELDRLIDKYDSPEWNSLQTSNDLVSLFTDHRSLILQEYNEVLAGLRKLQDTDFLGPKERRKRQLQKIKGIIAKKLGFNFFFRDRRQLDFDELVAEEDKKDYSKFFNALDKKLLEDRRAKIKAQSFNDDKAFKEWRNSQV